MVSNAMQFGSNGASAELARAIMETPSEAIIATDQDGLITFWNPGAERIFGHPAAEAVGQSLDIIIPERLRAAHWKGFSDVIRTGESRYGTGEVLSVPGIRRDGERISLDFTIVMLNGADGSIVGMAAIMRDVTARFEELKGLRRRLRELEQTPAT
ncbi:PAS domain S-box protein [Pseudonocardia aurantiaca]|uniref:histidine kinase n=1 Tax=Pseudonocardia aurantiaca TaxID=75290 RepID=A0ABW4FHE2_9PSEU